MKKRITKFLLFLDNNMDKFKKAVIDNRKTLIFIFLSVFIIGLCAYSFIFFNPSFSHDGLTSMIEEGVDDWKIALGRYIQPILRKTRVYANATWLIGLLSFVYLSMASFFICKTFDFKHKISLFLVSGILVLNISLCLTFMTYCHEGDMFCCSIMLASIAVYLFKRFKYGFLIGSVFVALSMGLYQAYVSVAICLIMLLTIKYLIQNYDFKKICIFVLKGVIMILIGGILYYIGLKVSLLITDMSLAGGYNGVGNIEEISLSRLPHLILNAYLTFIIDFTMIFRTSTSSIIFFGILLVLLMIISLILLFNGKKIPRIYYVMMFIIVAIYPIFANISGILSNGSIHSLMTYACCLVLILPIIIYENCEMKIGIKTINIFKYAICCTILIILYKNIVYANILSLKKYYNDRVTYSTMTRIVEDIEDIDDFVMTETPIYFIGELNKSSNFVDLAALRHYNGVGSTKVFTVTYEATYRNFLFYNFAYPIINITHDQVTSMIPDADTYIEDMPSFPQKGYVQYINGIILVKLS